MLLHTWPAGTHQLPRESSKPTMLDRNLFSAWQHHVVHWVWECCVSMFPNVAGTSEQLRGIFNKHHILVHCKPISTLREKLVHPQDKTSRHKLSNVIYSVQCSQDCTYLYTRETKQPLHKPMAHHKTANSSGRDSAVHLHLKGNNHSFQDNNVNRWFERGVKIHLCQTGLNGFEQWMWPKTLLITHQQCCTEFSPQTA